MGQEDGHGDGGTRLGGPNEGDFRPVKRARSAARRGVALLIAVVISSDVATIVVRRSQAGAGPGRHESASTVLFQDDFAGATAFDADIDASTGVQDETYRMRTDQDHYAFLPPEAPDRERVLQAQDISVAVDVEVVPGDSNTWFGLFCRFGGFGTDAYVASVRPDGKWTIDRTTLGNPYVQRVLAEGRAPAIENPQGAAFVAHLRLGCLGQVEASLVFSVNDMVVGEAIDASGLGPGNVGMAGSSTAGLIFDNLTVTETS